MKKIISTNNAPGAIGPYSQGVLANGTLYVSGQIPINPQTGELCENDIKIQTRQCLNNLKAIVTQAGLTLDNVVRCGVFLKDMNDFALMNEVYAEFFSKEFPTRAAVEVARLPKDVLVEIDCIAVE